MENKVQKRRFHQPSILVLRQLFLIVAPVFLLLALYVWWDRVDLRTIVEIFIIIGCISAFVIWRMISELELLANYIISRSLGKKTTLPELKQDSVIGRLSFAVESLYQLWNQKEYQMQAMLEEWEKLVDTLPEQIIMISSDKEILKLNTAARLVFGQNNAHRKLHEVIPSEILNKEVDDLLSHGTSKEIEFQLTLHGNNARYFRAGIERFAVYSIGGVAIIITLYDITELKMLEQMRADFVANASHEIKTPLASLIGFIETLQGPAKDDPKAREQFLSIMQEQANRMSDLVSDLLSLSKIELSVGQTPQDQVDIPAIIDNTINHLKWQAEERDARIIKDIQPGIIEKVTGDRSEITQVMHNLVSNAIKYGREGGEVRIILRITDKLPIDIISQNVRRALCVSVSDQGEGIPQEHIPRLTERFYRVSGSRSKKVSGTGLGLAIVKHILNRHNAALKIESELGKGSVFSVFFPLD